MNEHTIHEISEKIQNLMLLHAGNESAIVDRFSFYPQGILHEAAWRIILTTGGASCNLPLLLMVIPGPQGELPNFPLIVDRLRTLQKLNPQLLSVLQSQVVRAVILANGHPRPLLHIVLLLMCGGGEYLRYDEILVALSDRNFRLLICGFQSSNALSKKRVIETIDFFLENASCDSQSAQFFYNTLVILSSLSENHFSRLSAKIRSFGALRMMPSNLAMAVNKMLRLADSIDALKSIEVASPSVMGRTPLIAVCISGQLRGYEKAVENWKRVGFWGDSFVRFVHVWDTVGRREPEQMHLARCFQGRILETVQRYADVFGLAELRELYPELFRTFGRGPTVDVASLCEKFETQHVVVEREADVNFSDMVPNVIYYRNNVKMHYKMDRCYDLFMDSGIKPDLIIRMRPDREILQNRINWQEIFDFCNKNRVLFCDFDRSIADFGYFIGDQMAIGIGEPAEVYNKSFTRVLRDGVSDGSGIPRTMVGHETLALLTLMEGILIRNSPLRLGAFLEMDQISAGEFLKAVQFDSSSRAIKEIDLDLMKACVDDLKELGERGG